MVLKYSFKGTVFPQMYERSGRMAQYEASLFALEEVGAQVQIPTGLLPVFFRFFFFFFNPIFTLWLVSVYYYCWPFLASRDFCEKVFIVWYLKSVLFSTTNDPETANDPVKYWGIKWILWDWLWKGTFFCRLLKKKGRMTPDLRPIYTRRKEIE